jgi:hypothetical protein
VLIVEGSYLLEMPHVVDHMSLLAIVSVSCSTRASTSCTLPVPSVAAPASHSQYLAPCNSGDYYHLKSDRMIHSELAFLLSRSSH